jgi:hypothetical protein
MSQRQHQTNLGDDASTFIGYSQHTFRSGSETIFIYYGQAKASIDENYYDEK